MDTTKDLESMETLIVMIAKAIEPKFRGLGHGDTPRQIAYEVAVSAVAATAPLLGPLVLYISPDDVDLSRDDFLLAVSDRIRDDLAAKGRLAGSYE